MSPPSLQPASPRRLLRGLSLIAVLLGPLLSAAEAQDRRPSLDVGIEAWLVARPFVDDLHVPPSERISLEKTGPEVTGASVVIRFGGRIIGVGHAHSKDMDTLRQALAAAVQDARNSKRVRNLPFDMIESVGRGSTMELELAGTPVPLLGDTLKETADQIRPGIDGIAIRRGTRWQWAFPARMQAFGQADRPDRVLIRLLRDLGLPPRDPVELRRVDDVEFYRFDVLCLTQETPTGTPFEAVRGATVVHPHTPLRELAAEIARDAATNIEARLAVNPERPVGEIPGSDRLSAIGLFGDYDIARDAFMPLVGSAADQALAAWGLASYARNAPNLDQDHRTQLLQLVTLILTRLSVVDEVEAEPFDDPKTAAIIVLAGLEFNAAHQAIGGPIEQPTILAQAKTELLRQIEHDMPLDRADASTVLALCYLAATRLEEAQPGTVDDARIQALREAAWLQPTRESLVGSLHLLLLAEPQQADDPSAADRREAARHAINVAIASQIGHPDSLTATEDPVGDLAGGFVLAGSPRVTATANSLRPALAIAVALGLENAAALPDDRRAAWEQARALALRFARQLQIHSGVLARSAAPVRARGGLKSAPWSNQSRLADTALALLLASEVLQSAPD